VITVDGVAHYVPSYQVDGHVIWGLSAMMLVELLAEGFGMPIDLYQRPLGPLRHYPERKSRLSNPPTNVSPPAPSRSNK
jgi:hypothetical protein